MIIGADLPATKAVEQVLTRLGHVVCATATFGKQAIERVGEERPDLLLIDLDREGREIRFVTESRTPFGIPTLYLVDPADLHLLQRTELTNSVGCLLKPVIEQQLAVNIASALSMSKKEDHRKERIAELNRSLHESMNRAKVLDTILQSLSDGVVATSLKGEFILVNSVAEEIAGMGPTDTDPSEWSQTYGTFCPDGTTLCPAEDLPLVRAMRGESVDDVELILRNQNRPDGVTISVSGRPLTDNSGTQTGGVITVRDMTGIKVTERQPEETLVQTRNHSQVTEAILEAVGDPIIAVDSKGTPLLINAAARELLGPDITNTLFNESAEDYEIFCLDRVTPVSLGDLPLARAIRGEAVENMEIYVRETAGPKQLFLSVTGKPFELTSGSGSGGVVVLRDISQRVLAQQAILDAFSEGRLEVLETIVHNIGNLINHVDIGVGTIAANLKEKPLLRRFSAVMKAIEEHKDDLASFLQDDPKGQKAIEFLSALNRDLLHNNERLINTTERVVKAISQIVNIVRAERSAKRKTQLFKDVRPSEAINECVKMLRESLDKRGIEVAVKCGDLPAIIRIQESRLNQLIINLIKNAIEAIEELRLATKTTIDARIEIRAYDDGKFLIIEVIDNGIGIDPQNTPELFRAGFTTKQSGTGLGLHSAANFVVATGGGIEAISAGIGRGSTFRVRLRLTSIAAG